ncbi:sugar phosphate nucleotidyltransferase [uncultured Tenacibaculum sp.]|uniref:nucleotidyltransferase family protein n=1 Tax=uncultured Tenacibaculum sp. TaxID=174713 RepID=UPI00261C421B|nr:sugar phosphate nucleotidyltransferase [uncultured Tenacibaculum sp.]
MILVILAAGLGSRYGGLKQVDAVSDQNEAIIDFSIYDAIQCGFKKVVFIVRKEILDTLKNSYSHKLKNLIDIEFVCQEITDVPSEFINPNRKKPWGTAHALLVAKDTIDSNFCVINADDFYGRSSFSKMAVFFANTLQNTNTYAMIGFRIKNTLSKSGSVSRGECTLDNDGNLKQVIERTNISAIQKRIVYIDNNQEKEIEENTLVSMNFWGFTPTIFEELEPLFYQFLKENHLTEKNEFYLPTVVNHLLKKNNTSVKVIETDANWMGVTYKEDKAAVVSQITSYKKEGIYPLNLWNKN